MKKITKTILLLCLSLLVVFAGCTPVEPKTNLEDAPVAGGLYTGTCLPDGTATGTGTIEYENGNVYEGPVKDGKAEGEGVMIDAISAATYTGAFVGGLYNDDEAVLEFDNGGIYTGAFENGKMKGEGKFTWPDGSVFEGTFAGAEGVEGSAGALDAEGSLAFVGGIVFEGTIVGGYPNVGSFAWPSNGPIYTGNFTAFLTGYGDLDMRNGIIYRGPMGAGLLVPVDAWNALDEEVVITYPNDGGYNGEVFRGSYVFNAAENKDELIGTVTYTDGTVKNVSILLNFSFAYVVIGE